MFLLFNSNLSLFGYIMNGIIFNIKYVVYNDLILISINIIEYGFKYIKNKVINKQLICSENMLKG